MDFIEKVTSNKTYLSLREKLDEEQKKDLDERVVEMLQSASTVSMILRDIFSTQSSKEKFTKSLEEIIEAPAKDSKDGEE